MVRHRRLGEPPIVALGEEETFGFDVSGQGVRYTHSFETMGQYGSELDDYGQAINVRGEGPDQSIDGADVIVPQASFTRSIPFFFFLSSRPSATDGSAACASWSARSTPWPARDSSQASCC